MPVLIWLWSPFIVSVEENEYYDTEVFDNDATKKVYVTDKKAQKLNGLVNFYTAPVTQYIIDFTFFALFLVLYTYVCLLPFEDSLSWGEIALLYWFSVMVLVESFQLYNNGWYAYFSTFWNKNDVVIIVLYFFSFGLRMVGIGNYLYISDSKTILGMNAIPVYLRIVRFYAVSENLGPKIGLYSICCLISLFH